MLNFEAHLRVRFTATTVIASFLLLSADRSHAQCPPERFTGPLTLSSAPEGPTDVHAVDLDGDGDPDVLTASYDDDRIAWYENMDGLGSFGPQQTITTNADGALAVLAADIDGDGDNDVLSASRLDDRIAWYENTDGQGTFGPQQTISTANDGLESIFAIDLDGDGDADVLSASRVDNRIAWYQNTDGQGTFGPQQTISTANDGLVSIFAIDLDGDGDNDVLSAYRLDDRIAWYENTDGQGTFGPQKIITNSADHAVLVIAADLDADGDADVLSASVQDYRIAWYENIDGLGSFGPPQTISAELVYTYSLIFTDLDADGDPDLLAAASMYDGRRLSWFENSDGLGAFEQRSITSTMSDATTNVFAADLDGDGDNDILSASHSDNRIAWYENAIVDCNSNGTSDVCDAVPGFSDQQIINTSTTLPSFVYATDFDGDGDADVLSTSMAGVVAWFENIDGQGAFGPIRTIATGAIISRSAFAADLDGDGDADVLSVSQTTDRVAWYENTDGQGTFGPQQVITNSADQAVFVLAADLDGDGDTDVLSASFADNRIAWYENTDGLGTFGPQLTISVETDLPWCVFASDLDGDGDIDVLSASANDDRIAWYENTDGLGTFGPQKTITTTADGARSVFAIDLDDDGDIDVLSASSNDDRIAWYENTDGQGTFGPQQTITSELAYAWCVFATDLDGDTDVDVLSVSYAEDRIAWFENLDGAGTFAPEQTISTAVDQPWSVFATDLDGDGNNDVLSASLSDGRIAWYKNKGRDCNGNYVPDACELSDNDCNSNNVPDDCETDCNGNGIPDDCESTEDCNLNGIPDECDTLTVFSAPNSLSTTPVSAIFVFATDLDGDGDADILSASYNEDRIAWYENTDGQGTYGPQQIISTAADGAEAVYATDLDGDGDIDVLSASANDDRIAWYENTDGQGTFGPQQSITTAIDAPLSVSAADLDGDGDADVLSASLYDDRIAWYENIDGQGTFGPLQTISTAAEGARCVFASDLDGDGDFDVLSASTIDDRIAWYENIDGLGTFGPQQSITMTAIEATSAYAADVDGDGDADVLSASYDLIAWYENTDGQGAFGPPQTITNSVLWAQAVFAVDLDGDDDVDVVSASYWDDRIAWYENTDGLGTFGPQQTITSEALGIQSVFATDLDGDGDTDIVSSHGSNTGIAWFENTGNDCNGNRVPDACELLDNDCNSNGVPDECDPDSNGNGVPDECEAPCGALQRGDVDASGVLDAGDVSPFAAIVLAPTTAMGDALCTADVNQDGAVNGDDVQGFVTLLLAP